LPLPTDDGGVTPGAGDVAGATGSFGRDSSTSVTVVVGGRAECSVPALAPASWAKREATEGRTSELELPCDSCEVETGGSEAAIACFQAVDVLSLSRRAFTPSVFCREKGEEGLGPSPLVVRLAYVHVCDARYGYAQWPEKGGWGVVTPLIPSYGSALFRILDLHVPATSGSATWIHER
jgi:hypothetical protein